MKISNLKKTFKNKKVIVTGHTGFKGAWLTFWLKKLGANILGISYNSKTKPSIFKTLNLKDGIKNKNLDIRNLKKLRKELQNFKPDFVFHLAAQSLVKTSYENPETTFKSNCIGTLNILESLRNLKKKCTVVLVTSDKSYKNLEIKRGHKETDQLGGLDPYSASKACAEIIIQSYIQSFHKTNRIFIAVGRAGNVIGGGDWSKDRLIPDCFKSWSNKKDCIIRNPNSTRPWQHVVEVVYGYMVLAKQLSTNSRLHGEVFNFGPSYSKNYKVKEILSYFKFLWNRCTWKTKTMNTIQKESVLLKLNSTKAKKVLKWKTSLSLKETLVLTLDWYKNYYIKKKEIITFQQIKQYKNKLNKFK